ncbi:hypothetical protein Pint_05266 [Pistacia integerrima]|uniref:Uncharacterized protein n=1 Tax=Pistacia integerrima TaxID=434235 RepID=A0ACC0Z8E1_9ROSI|nr:hypothetical protein Pint_05266 [Pistacia integerrima]
MQVFIADYFFKSNLAEDFSYADIQSLGFLVRAPLAQLMVIFAILPLMHVEYS